MTHQQSPPQERSDFFPLIILGILIINSLGLSYVFDLPYAIAKMLILLSGVYIITLYFGGLLFAVHTFDQQTAFAPALWLREMKTAFILGYFLPIIKIATLDVYRMWDGALPERSKIEAEISTSSFLLVVLLILLVISAVAPGWIANYTPLWGAENGIIRQIFLPGIVAVLAAQLASLAASLILLNELGVDPLESRVYRRA